MRRLVIAFALVALVAAGAAQPADAGPNGTSPEDNDTFETNETEDEETNETEGPPEDVPGESAQFDARLMTAINTVDTLVEIAPDDESSKRLQEALEILRGVQEDTDTKSLGPDGHEDHNHTHDEEKGNETDEQESGQRGPPENAGQGNRGGPRTNQAGGPPSFVRNMLSGIFG